MLLRLWAASCWWLQEAGKAKGRQNLMMCIGDSKMKKLFWGTLLLTLISVVTIPTMARADVNVRIALPPPIVFEIGRAHV